MKGPHCRLHCTREAVFSFFENVGVLHDGGPCNNIKLIPCVLKCGYGLINLQKSLRKPGKNCGSPEKHWD